MPRSVNAALLAAVRSETFQPIGLVEIATGSTGTPYIRRTDREYDVTFGSATYSAGAVELGRVEVSQQTETGGIDVRVGDPDGAIAALIVAGTNFRGTRVRTWISDAAVVAANPTQEYGFLSIHYVESAAIEDGAAVFHCRSQLSVFDLDIPRNTYDFTAFPNLAREA